MDATLVSNAKSNGKDKYVEPSARNPHALLSTGKAYRQSRLESAFIEKLRQKYPNAVSRSLTNLTLIPGKDPQKLTVFGQTNKYENSSPRVQSRQYTFESTRSTIHTPECKLESTSSKQLSNVRSVLCEGNDEQHCLAEQPEFSSKYPHHPSYQHENELQPLILLPRAKGYSPIDDTDIETDDRKQRDLVSKMVRCEAAWSSSHMSAYGRQRVTGSGSPEPGTPATSATVQVPLSVLPSALDDDTDDSAPNCVSGTPLLRATGLSTVQLQAHAPYQPQMPSKMLTSDVTKCRLDELRLQLAKTCEALLQKKADICRQVQFCQEENPPKQSRLPYTSPILAPEKTKVFHSKCTKSGTDSDGDSGIGHMTTSSSSADGVISKKESGLISLTPKLRKPDVVRPGCQAPDSRKDHLTPLHESYHNSMLTTAHPNAGFEREVRNPDAMLAASDIPVIIKSKEDKRCQTNVEQQSLELTAEGHPNSTLLRSNTTSRTMQVLSPAPPKQAGNPAITSQSKKSVRFGNSTEIASELNPHLKELKELAEAEVFSSLRPVSPLARQQIILPETKLEDGFDTASSSELCSSEDDCKDCIDPRLAQLVTSLSSTHYIATRSKPRINQHVLEKVNQKDGPPVCLPQSKPVNSIKYAKNDSRSSVAMPHSDETSALRTSEALCSYEDASPPQILKSHAPPKPQRVNGKNTDCRIKMSDSNAIGQPELTYTQEPLHESPCDPYAVVDASAFKLQSQMNRAERLGSLATVTNGLTMGNHGEGRRSNSETIGNHSAGRHEAVGGFSTTEKPPLPQTLPPRRSPHQIGATSENPERADSPMKQPTSAIPMKKARAFSYCSNLSTASLDLSDANVPNKLKKRTVSSDDLWGSNVSLNSDVADTSASTAKSSLRERVGSFRQAAKHKMKSIRRALSLERLSSAPGPSTATANDGALESAAQQPEMPLIKKSLSLKSLQLPFGKKKGVTVLSKPPTSGSKKTSATVPVKANAAIIESPSHIHAIGQLLQLNSDGSRVIQVNKPPQGPYGFHFGQAKQGHSEGGVFVSKLDDNYVAKLFSGLISVGDEIMEINGMNINQFIFNDICNIMERSDNVILRVKSCLQLQDERF